ncbi:hypothetical protein [Bradyrhizobium forestalis]|nr:hypothetical protein [Bradyrhizobium forestalis]
MGRALAKPITLGGPTLSMGFAALYPSYGLAGKRSLRLAASLKLMRRA